MMPATETVNDVFAQWFANVRKAADENLEMQQQLFQKWSRMWPGIPNPQASWLERMREFQKEWAKTVSDLARKHRETLDRQYQAAIESLDESLKLVQASDPVQFREYAEQLCRKTLDCSREIAETQLREFQEAVGKWTEVVTKAGG
jgi:hypothetical protein